MEKISRREILRILSFAGLGTFSRPLIDLIYNEQSMLKRSIPSSGELLPVVGLGTWIQFNVGMSKEERNPLRQVLTQMAKKGGKVIDSSPMYGNSEKVIGDLANAIGKADHFFYATKVWTQGLEEGIQQMNNSMEKMRRARIDLMQVHNLLDWKTHLNTLKKWKEEGKVRYIGVTHYTVSSHNQLQRIIKSEDIDFVQFNYSIGVRNAEESLLETARDNGVGVIINEPYQGGALFRAVKGKELPEWVSEYDISSWGQYFLKYILSHQAVTCVIPGTSNPKHLVDNMGAGFGKMPDSNTRKRMFQYFKNI